MRDDKLILEDLPLVEPGTYEAVILSTKKVRRFGLVMVEFRFRIVSPGPAFNVQLLGYCGLGSKDGARVRPHSKLASWMRLIATFTGSSPSHVTLRSFRQYWLRVEVDTVTRNYRQQPLAPHDCYSMVVGVVEVVGRMGEPASEHQSGVREGEAS